MASIKSEVNETLIKKETTGESLIVLQPEIKLIPKPKIKAENSPNRKLPEKNFKVKNLLPDKFLCRKCDKKFKFKTPFEDHLVFCGRKTFDCNYCEKKFIKKESLKAHCCTKCKYCSKNFETKYLLDQHINSAHTEKSKQTHYECDYCGRQFLYRTVIYRHLKVLHVKSNETFHCDNCPLQFNTIQAIRNHMRKHASLIECEICGKKLNMHGTIYTHMKIVHGEEPRKFQCPKCPSKFKLRAKLARHLLVHDKLVCYIKNCGMKFSDEGEYNYHVKSHDNPDLLTCKVCGKKLKSKPNLKLHMTLIHGKRKELKFECNRCDYKTYNKGHLNKHLKVHEDFDEKLKEHPNWYRCDKCPFALIKCKSALKNHMKMKHIESNLFECETCKRVYKSKDNLKRHKCK